LKKVCTGCNCTLSKAITQKRVANKTNNGYTGTEDFSTYLSLKDSPKMGQLTTVPVWTLVVA